MDAKECPWCKRWCLKDANCNYIFACGLDEHNKFQKDMGCGRSWCFECGKRFCSFYYDSFGNKCKDAKNNHDQCCMKEMKDLGLSVSDYCPGGHNSHCEKRW